MDRSNFRDSWSDPTVLPIGGSTRFDVLLGSARSVPTSSPSFSRGSRSSTQTPPFPSRPESQTGVREESHREEYLENLHPPVDWDSSEDTGLIRHWGTDRRLSSNSNYYPVPVTKPRSVTPTSLYFGRYSHVDDCRTHSSCDHGSRVTSFHARSLCTVPPDGPTPHPSRSVGTRTGPGYT